LAVDVVGVCSIVEESARYTFATTSRLDLSLWNGANNVLPDAIIGSSLVVTFVLLPAIVARDSFFVFLIAGIVQVIGCVQQKKLLCNCCKIRESDWRMLLILNLNLRAYANQIHEFYNSCKAAFPAERSHSLDYLQPF